MVKIDRPIDGFSLNFFENTITDPEGQTLSILGENVFEFTDVTIDRSNGEFMFTGGDAIDTVVFTTDIGFGQMSINGGSIVQLQSFSQYKFDLGAGDDSLKVEGNLRSFESDRTPVLVNTGAGDDLVVFKDLIVEELAPAHVFPNVIFLEGGNDTVVGSIYNEQAIITLLADAVSRLDGKDGYDGVNLNTKFGVGEGGVKVNLATGKITAPLGTEERRANAEVEIATATNFEEAILTFGSDQAAGNSAANTFKPTFGTDTIDGAGQPAGTLGDIIEIFTEGTANLGTGRAVGRFYDYTFKNIEGFLGSPFEDKLIGNGSANFFKTNQGNDTVIGGAGTDVVALFGDPQQYTIDLGAGTITDQFFGRDGNDKVSSIEILAFANLTRGFNMAANTSFTADYDELRCRGYYGEFWDGGTGFDTFTLNVQPHYSAGGHQVNILAHGTFIAIQDIGEAGKVTIADLTAMDKIIVNTKAGADVSASGDFGLTDLDRATITLNGDGFANVFDAGGISSSHRVVMSGAGGRDVLLGGGGKDVLDGGTGNNKLAGGSNNDSLTGGIHSDTLSGGAGRDTLTGGAGVDFFDFDAKSESPRGLQRDLITDFNPGGTATRIDRIDLATIDANETVAGNQAFAFIGQAAFKAGFLAGKGQLRAVEVGSTTVVSGETTGDKLADFQVTIGNDIALANLTGFDFVL